MKGMYTGLGLVFGAGLGMIVGLVLLETWWYGMGIGAAIGLVLGSMVEALTRDKEPGRGV